MSFNMKDFPSPSDWLRALEEWEDVAACGWAANAFDRIRAICEDGERSGADRLDEIYRIVKTGTPAPPVE